MGGLWGIALGRAKVGERWRARLEALEINDLGAGRTLVEYLGQKRALETVESNNVAEEFCWITQLIAE
jgi:hypothetical protein